MADQEHVFIKLFYPVTVGTVTEADLDQLLLALRKVYNYYSGLYSLLCFIKHVLQRLG